MMRTLAAATALCLMTACTHSDGYLGKTPDPPPGPPRYAKNYKFDLNTSEKANQDVDILWVIDNSSSMRDKQANVIANADHFMKAFTSSTVMHWRMGLISTALGEQPYMGFANIVDWNTQDAIGQFSAAVNRLGLAGDTNEQSFQPTLNVLHDYPDFLRKGAFFIQIIVSDELEDENNRSNVSVDSYLNQIYQLMGVRDRFAVFAINSDVSNLPGNTRYRDVVDRTGGKSYDIYSPDYGVLLAQLGADLVARTTQVDPVILLDQKPKPETIIVRYKGRELRPGAALQGGEWSYDPNYNLIRVHNPKLIDATRLDVNVSFVIDDGTTTSAAPSP